MSKDLTSAANAKAYIRECAAYGDSARQIGLYTIMIDGLIGAIGMCESNGWTDREIGFREASGALRLERLRMRQRLGLHA